MKKHGIKIVSVILALTMVFSGFSIVGASAADAGTTLKNAGVGVLGGIVKGLLSAINFVVPDNKNFVKMDDYKNDYFYSGTETMLDEPAANSAMQRLLLSPPIGSLRLITSAALCPCRTA